MSDMNPTIIAKSTQLNADDLIGREITIQITGVDIKPGQDQPVAISYAGDENKPYRCCKSMARILVAGWGADSKKYIGRSLTLYRDPLVKWGGMQVGGIRISHMSDISESLTMALTASKGNKKLFTVKPMSKAEVKLSQPVATEPLISDAARKRLEARITEVKADREAMKKYMSEKWGVEHFKDLNKAQYAKLDEMLDRKAMAMLDAKPAERDIDTEIANCETLDKLEALADAFTEAEAVAFTKAYADRKSALLDAEGGM